MFGAKGGGAAKGGLGGGLLGGGAKSGGGLFGGGGGLLGGGAKGGDTKGGGLLGGIKGGENKGGGLFGGGGKNAKKSAGKDINTDGLTLDNIKNASLDDIKKPEQVTNGVKTSGKRDIKKEKPKKELKKIKTKEFIKSFSFNGVELYNEFLPFAAFYDSTTMISKNGDLMKTIAIPLLSRIEGNNNINIMRTYLRKAIRKVFVDPKIGIWIHTIRNPHDMVDKDPHFRSFICRTVNDKWIEGNRQREQFVNEIYITIVYNSIDLSCFHPQIILTSVFSFFIKPFFRSKIHKAFVTLDDLVKKFLKHIELLKPKLLGIEQKEDGYYYADNLAVFSNIMNLKPQQEPVRFNDLSEQIGNQRMHFGRNYCYVMEPDGTKRFACILSSKNSPKIQSDRLDELLQLPFQFVISQSIDFTDRNRLVKRFAKQHFLQEASKDGEFFEGMGLLPIFEEEEVPDPTGSAGYDDSDGTLDLRNRFCTSQINLLILGEDKDILENNAKCIVSKAEEVGWVLFREDMLQEYAFWAQFPSSFSEVKRQFDMQTNDVGEFASTFTIPYGYSGKSIWGNPACMFESISNTPYFFSFHCNYNYGNTLIVGHDSYAYKEMLNNFLLAEADKYGYQLFMMDRKRHSEIFISTMGGSYHRFIRDPDDLEEEQVEKTQLHLNPFTLEDSEANRDFLTKWVVGMASHDFDEEKLAYDEKVQHLQDEFKNVRMVIDEIMQQQITEPVNLISAIPYFDKEGTSFVHSKLLFWQDDKNAYKALFNDDQDNLMDPENDINAVDLFQELQDPNLQRPLLLYLMHRILGYVASNKPTIVVLNGLLKLVNQTDMSSVLTSWIGQIEKMNSIIITLTENLEDPDEHMVDFMVRKSTTLIFPSHRKMLEAKFNNKIFKLDTAKVDRLKYYGKKNMHFIIRQVGRGEAFLDFDYHKLGYYRKILYADAKALAEFETMAYEQQHGDYDPEILLPQLVDKFKDVYAIK